MAGLDPVIHVTSAATVRTKEGVDHRVKPGDVDHYESRCQHAATDYEEPDSRGLDPAIHVTSAATVRTEEGVDHRVKPGVTTITRVGASTLQPIAMNRTAVGQARP